MNFTFLVAFLFRLPIVGRLLISMVVDQTVENWHEANLGTIANPRIHNTAFACISLLERSPAVSPVVSLMSRLSLSAYFWCTA